jgi:hypothetical protein
MTAAEIAVRIKYSNSSFDPNLDFVTDKRLLITPHNNDIDDVRIP